MPKTIQIWLFVLTAWWTTTTHLSLAQTDNNRSPIYYSSATPTDRIAKLMKQIDSGRETMDWDQKHGWLPDVLDKLEIPRSSQLLVFSKTSQQNRKIDPSRPRAIYFNEDVYLGFVPTGEFLEIAAVDPVHGAIFYTLDQQRSKTPRFERAAATCLACHESRKTQDVPGFLVRSVFSKSSGHPDFRFGTTTTDHTTKFSDRFGGWYVTGQHGEMRHRGNVFVKADAVDDNNVLDRESGANLESLSHLFDVGSNLEPTSDIVALMLLEHQTQFHNFVTKASYTTRKALHHQQTMNELLEREKGFRSESTRRRIDQVAKELVHYLFFKGEFQLTSPIQGSDAFAADFAKNAIRDSKGRSLKDLDLSNRILKYPCSYLIYSESFVSLPKPVMGAIKNKIDLVLNGMDKSEDYQHLTEADRQAIKEILVETHPLFSNSQERIDE